MTEKKSRAAVEQCQVCDEIGEVGGHYDDCHEGDEGQQTVARAGTGVVCNQLEHTQGIGGQGQDDREGDRGDQQDGVK